MGKINIKYDWYIKVLIIIAILYVVFVALALILKKEPIEQEIILTKKNHVITEDGVSWYSESDE